METVEYASRVPSVLVIDDHEQNRELVAAQLSAAGFAVREASSGPGGIQSCADNPPDLILLDVLMPGLNGFETCQRLRELPASRNVPIIILTSLNDLHTQEKAVESGADDFLTKPLQRTELLIRVRSLIRIKLLQTELRNSYQLILDQRNALLRIQGQKDELVAMLVHDLKSPLATISLNLGFLQEAPKLSIDEQEALADSIQAARQLETLAINMLSLGRAEDGRWVPTIAQMEIREIVESLARAFKHRLIARRQTLSVSCPDQGRILGDSDLLHRLVENLLDNCVKYSPAGSAIEIEVKAEQDGFLELRVKDQGAGIPPELRSRIFEKYVRLERNMQAAAHRSMGLGLAFCRMAAEVHGGRIWVEENQPRGSCFCVRLPVSGPTPCTTQQEIGAMAAVP